MKHLKIETEDGAVIEYRYKDVEQLKLQLQKITSKDVQINIFEVKKPDLDACHARCVLRLEATWSSETMCL